MFNMYSQFKALRKYETNKIEQNFYYIIFYSTK